MSDIFHEVDEEVRREQLKKLWDHYQNYIIAVIFLILLAVGGYRGYEYWEGTKATEFGTAFEEAITLSQTGKHAEAEQAFAKIAADGTSTYQHMARMRQAAEVAERDAKAATVLYEQVAADASAGPVLQDLAGVRAGALLIDQGSYAEARTRLEPVSGADRTFRHAARELLALASWRAGDSAQAKRWFDLITADVQTPAATRDRVEMLMALIPSEKT